MRNGIQKMLPIAGIAIVLIVIAIVVIRAYVDAPTLPTPGTSPLSPLEAQSPDDLPAPPPIPQPSAGLGVIHGRLIDESGRPVPNFPLYLAIIWTLQTETGTEETLLMDTAQAISTQTDNNGYFIFTNVKPDKYGIHYGKPGDIGAAFAREEGSQKAILYELTADSTLDAGKIVRRFPPDANP